MGEKVFAPSWKRERLASPTVDVALRRQQLGSQRKSIRMSTSTKANPRQRFSTRFRLALWTFTLCGLAGLAQAESELILPMPAEFGAIPALTFDLDGKQRGTATLSIDRIDENRALVRGAAALESGGRTRFQAELAILEGESGLQLLQQESQSHNQQGESMGLLHVDHAKGIATCTPPPRSERQPVVVKLGEHDRVANIGLSLLFQPLAAGSVQKVLFQILLCRDDPQVLDFEAIVVARSAPEADRKLVKILYQPDFGALLSWIAQAVVPDLFFWFDVTKQPFYLAHEMPLFASGPEIRIVREGVTPELLDSVR